MTLDTLTKTLRDQAAANQAITLNGDVLSADVLAQIRAAFLLGPDEFLTVSNIKATDIPDPKQGMLQIEAGTVALFSQSGIVPRLIFTVDANNAVQCVIAVGMGSSWTFTTSFPNLNLFPFNQVAVSEAYFVYSSLAQDSFAPWADKPNEMISLVAGLNFATWMTLNIFSGAVALLLNQVTVQSSRQQRNEVIDNRCKLRA